MHKNRILRTAVLFVFLFILGFTGAAYYSREISQCMGVAILSEKEMADITDYVKKDLSGVILLDGYPAAIDKETETIYVSQQIDDETCYTDFKGAFSSADGNITLYFAEDANLANPAQSVRDGHKFVLVAALPDGSFVKYNVVFTTLPVINMGGEVTGVRKAGPFDATGDRDVYTGVISVWDGAYEGTRGYSAKSSDAQWHQRGNYTFSYEKKSWKISFKDKKGNNADMDFLGLEADDDWILNSLVMDDTRLREKTVMDLWNSGAAAEDYNFRMSTGKYVELVNNGRYMGVYLLQRRMDAKYLEVEDDVHIAKGGKGEILYETVNTTDEATTLDTLITMRQEGKVEYLDVDNWIDNSLIVDAFYMADNAARYNTFYIIKDMYTQPKISIALWDTDFSFGLGYNSGFVHEPEKTDQLRRNKDELYLLAEIHPEIYEKMSQRWAQLRQGMLSTENVIGTITANYNKLNESGAFARDDALWKNEYGTTDTYETMCQYVRTRMEYLDRCYANGDIIRETGDVVPNK